MSHDEVPSAEEAEKLANIAAANEDDESTKQERPDDDVSLICTYV